MAGIGGGRRAREGTLESGSGWEDGTYEGMTQGPAGGFGRGFAPGPGGGGDMMSMFESLMADKKARARAEEGRRSDVHSEYMREQRKKRAPKMEAAKRRGAMDPMRYANQARTAARNAQFQKGGMGSYGQGELAMEHKGERAFEHAMGAYPMYYQAMMS